jgi:acetamidase/formamidase
MEKQRVLEIGSRRFTEVQVFDALGAGGACHEYRVCNVSPHPTLGVYEQIDFAKVSFQNGPIKESGVNGCHNEDLIAIVIDRLQCFQAGDYACRENAIALTKLEEAMHWLNHRTQARINRGVEGTHQK